jgi:threonine synthase
MKFRSTRTPEHQMSLSEALQQSLAPDGGLYVPVHFPRFQLSDFDGAEELPEIAARWLTPFFQDDPLAQSLEEICRETFNFPVPLKALDAKTSILELFHGPTAAFKDVGARFLSGCLQRIPSDHLRTVLVATSGDTGSAVAAAFHGRPGFEVIVLFPKGKVSSRQEKQLTVWGDNVRAFAVRGDFDDCQRMAKAAFQDPWWQQSLHLISANSINLGRLLPQACYHAAASLWHLRRRGQPTGFIIPSGNLGNATAALWARETGLPIGPVTLATNTNHAVSHYHRSGRWEPRPTVTTLANAMDVGNPSNMERVRQLYREHNDFQSNLYVIAVSDEEIKNAISTSQKRWSEVFCPHTATAARALEQLPIGPWTLVATAHPAKFELVVEPIIGQQVAVPEALQALLDRPSRVVEIDPDLDSLRAHL